MYSNNIPHSLYYVYFVNLVTGRVLFNKKTRTKTIVRSDLSESRKNIYVKMFHFIVVYIL